MAHNCPECGTDVADDDRIVCESCDAVPVRPAHYCGCCGFLVPHPDGPNSRCAGCRAGDVNDQCDPAITGHDDFYPAFHLALELGNEPERSN